MLGSGSFPTGVGTWRPPLIWLRGCESCSGGVMTTHRNPTSLPEEHSCLNAISSQNCSSVLMLFHCPLLCRFEGLFWLAWESGSSASNSSRNLALGSSGKCGIKHRGGTLAFVASCGSGCELIHILRSGGSFFAEPGRNDKVSYLSQPGTIKYPFTLVASPGAALPSPAPCSSLATTCCRKTVSKTPLHHLTSPRSSNTCLELFSILPGKRY